MRLFAALSKFFKALLPIHRHELVDFLPKFSLFFLIAMVYNLLRPLKIALVISSPSSGAEIIPYIKVWGVLPAALLFTYLFTRLQSRFSREHVFYMMASLFLGFFVLFATVLFPYRDYWELKDISESMNSILPTGLKGLVAMIRYWHYTLFYLFSELWGSVILSMLFWGYVNEVTPIHQANRFYGMFAFGANLASVAAGQIGVSLSDSWLLTLMPFGETSWDQSVYSILMVAILAALMIMIIFFYLNRRENNQMTTEQRSEKKAPAEHFTLWECFVQMVYNPYLRYLALIVLGYNLVFNITDVLWTNQLHLYFGDQARELNAYVSKVTLAKGILAALIAIFISGHSLRILGWRFTALVTPMILGVTSLLFFPLILGENTWISDLFLSLFNTPLLAMTVLIGGIQNGMTRASKYTVFDATKEIAYIPLSKHEKRKGKAVIDGVGSRFGKSAGSVTFQIMLIFCSSLTATVPYAGIIVGVTCIIWIYSIYQLNKLMKA